MADSEQCPLQLTAQLLHIKTAQLDSKTILTALDDYFHVPRHAPYIELSQQRVERSIIEFETHGTLPVWARDAITFLSQDPHLSTHHHSNE